jgi:hypothetical protein
MFGFRRYWKELELLLNFLQFRFYVLYSLVLLKFVKFLYNLGMEKYASTICLLCHESVVQCMPFLLVSLEIRSS